MEDELRPEYDLTELRNGIRAKYFDRYKRGSDGALPTENLANDLASSESQADDVRYLVITTDSNS
jgi:hypothetical protein